MKGLHEYQEVVLRHVSKNIGHTTSAGVAAADYVAPKEQEVCFSKVEFLWITVSAPKLYPSCHRATLLLEQGRGLDPNNTR